MTRFNLVVRPWAMLLIALVTVSYGCGEDTIGPVDTIAPGDIADLAATFSGTSSVTLMWTATGDDNDRGTATTYDLRYHTAPITSSNWDAATKVQNVPAPKAAFAEESFTVTGLDPATPYHFAIVALDEAQNGSSVSNSVPATTSELPIFRAGIYESRAVYLACGTSDTLWTDISLDTLCTDGPLSDLDPLPCDIETNGNSMKMFCEITGELEGTGCYFDATLYVSGTFDDESWDITGRVTGSNFQGNCTALEQCMDGVFTGRRIADAPNPCPALAAPVIMTVQGGSAPGQPVLTGVNGYHRDLGDGNERAIFADFTDGLGMDYLLGISTPPGFDSPGTLNVSHDSTGTTAAFRYGEYASPYEYFSDTASGTVTITEISLTRMVGTFSVTVSGTEYDGVSNQTTQRTLAGQFDVPLELWNPGSSSEGRFVGNQ